MLWDMMYLLFYTGTTIFQSGLSILRPPPMKSVNNDIAVVHSGLHK